MKRYFIFIIADIKQFKKIICEIGKK